MSHASLRSIVVLLCFVLLINQTSLAAPKPLTPDQARQQIQKVHIDRFVFIREVNGVELQGRILSIDSDAFTMQTGNHPETTTIPYNQLAYVRGQPSNRTQIIAISALVGAAVIGAILIHHAYENSVANMPKVPNPATP